MKTLTDIETESRNLAISLAEFSIGEEVTFKPYEKACKCVVKDIQLGAWGEGRCLSGEDDRIFYKLTGEAISLSTGKSIVESKYFDPAE